jgi:HD-like signal output (HDOD) protein/prolyl-tRNA editing enzyme YbaK/EbsC (Cys-tRNA(Pro) deacylase)
MKVANQVEKQFLFHHIDYEAIPVDDKSLSLEELDKKFSNNQQVLLRTVLIRCNNQIELIIVPVNELIDFSALEGIKENILDIIPLAECANFYPSCDVGIVPPISSKEVARTHIANSINNFSTVVFETGKANDLVSLSTSDFYKLHKNALTVDITTPAKDLVFNEINETESKKLKQKFTPDNDKKNNLQRLYKLPPLPDIATKVIQLKNNPSADAKSLASLIERDPSLTAQVIRYSKSAFFNYQGEITSVQEAISRVLGFDLVMNMALGLSAGKALKNPPDGPLGLNEFWKHAVYSATLAQRLSQKIPQDIRPNSNLAYLSGLLHNFGFLLLGHLFQPEFFLLNKLYAANLKCSIVAIEKHALGMGAGQNAINMGHAELGSWLLDNWQIPKEVIVATKEHHNHGYSGEHSNYASLIALVDSALGIHGIGDNRNEYLNTKFCKALKISPDVVLEELEKIISEHEQIESIAKQFAA